jgi:hypothetical protein
MKVKSKKFKGKSWQLAKHRLADSLISQLADYLESTTMSNTSHSDHSSLVNRKPKIVNFNSSLVIRHLNGSWSV